MEIVKEKAYSYFCINEDNPKKINYIDLQSLIIKKLNRFKALYVFDEVGCGKTIQGIYAILDCIYGYCNNVKTNEPNILIITGNDEDLAKQWEEKIKHYLDIDSKIWYNKQCEKKQNDMKCINITFSGNRIDADEYKNEIEIQVELERLRNTFEKNRANRPNYGTVYYKSQYGKLMDKLKFDDFSSLGIYELLVNKLKQDPNFQWDLVIFDEAQNISFPYYCFLEAILKDKCKKVLFLTATPYDNPNKELFKKYFGFLTYESKREFIINNYENIYKYLDNCDEREGIKYSSWYVYKDVKTDTQVYNKDFKKGIDDFIREMISIYQENTNDNQEYQIGNFIKENIEINRKFIENDMNYSNFCKCIQNKSINELKQKYNYWFDIDMFRNERKFGKCQIWDLYPVKHIKFKDTESFFKDGGYQARLFGLEGNDKLNEDKQCIKEKGFLEYISKSSITQKCGEYGNKPIYISQLINHFDDINKIDIKVLFELWKKTVKSIIERIKEENNKNDLDNLEKILNMSLPTETIKTNEYITEGMLEFPCQKYIKEAFQKDDIKRHILKLEYEVSDELEKIWNKVNSPYNIYGNVFLILENLKDKKRLGNDEKIKKLLSYYEKYRDKIDKNSNSYNIKEIDEILNFDKKIELLVGTLFFKDNIKRKDNTHANSIIFVQRLDTGKYISSILKCVQDILKNNIDYDVEKIDNKTLKKLLKGDYINRSILNDDIIWKEETNKYNFKETCNFDNEEDKKLYEKSMNNKESINKKILIGTWRTIGVGYNIYGADTIIAYELPARIGHLEQGFGRIDRAFNSYENLYYVYILPKSENGYMYDNYRFFNLCYNTHALAKGNTEDIQNNLKDVYNLPSRNIILSNYGEEDNNDFKKLFGHQLEIMNKNLEYIENYGEVLIDILVDEIIRKEYFKAMVASIIKEESFSELGKNQKLGYSNLKEKCNDKYISKDIQIDTKNDFLEKIKNIGLSNISDLDYIGCSSINIKDEFIDYIIQIRLNYPSEIDKNEVYNHIEKNIKLRREKILYNYIEVNYKNKNLEEDIYTYIKEIYLNKLPEGFRNLKEEEKSKILFYDLDKKVKEIKYLIEDINFDDDEPEVEKEQQGKYLEKYPLEDFIKKIFDKYKIEHLNKDTNISEQKLKFKEELRRRINEYKKENEESIKNLDNLSTTFLYFKGTEQKLDFLEPNEILKVYRNIFDKPLEEIPEDAREFIQECRDFVKDFKNKINENN